jgi:beta-lactamase regulating signal transducer with metallopeptidase domain
VIILLSCAIRAAVILAVALGLARLLSRQTASLRHAVLSIAMGCVAIAPALGVLLPSWTPTLVTLPAFVLAPARVERSSPAAETPDAAARAGASASTARSSVANVSAPDAATREIESAESATMTAPQSVARPPNVARWLEGVYVAGAALVFAAWIAGLLRLAWLTARSEPIHDGPSQLELATIAHTYGVRRSVRLRRSRHPSVLAAWGLVRPQILLPAGSEHWTSGRIRVVLLHELAHIRRNDWIVQVLAGALRIVYWFNPLIWIASSRLRHESERACDDLVVSHDVDAHEYAGHLLALARLLNRGPASWTSAPSMAAPSSLRARVAAILDPDANHARARRSAVASVAMLLLIVTAPVAAFRVSAPVASSATSPTSRPRTARQSTRIDISSSAIVTTPRVDVGTGASAPAATATTRVPHPVTPDLSPVDPSPKTTAVAVLDLIQSTPLSDPTSVLSAHTFLRSMTDTLQRAARAVIDDDGSDATSTQAKSTALLNALTNAANAAATIVSRRNTSPETARALIALAAALRTQAADLRAIVSPIVVPAVGAGASPLRRAAVAALTAVQTARADDPLWQHAFLATQLETVERTAQSALNDDGMSERVAAAAQTAFSNALLAAANAASTIGGRPAETDHVRRATVELAAALRAIAAPLVDTIQTSFAIRLPSGIQPERASIFYSLAPSGRMPNSVTTKPGVFDYAIDTKATHDLKLLLVVPGYQIVTTQFTDAEMRSAQPYTPQLIPLSRTLRGRLVDSSRRPMRNVGLNVGYVFLELIGYFCGTCTVDGRIDRISLGETRTDDTGAFSFVIPDVRDDPFFRRYAAAGAGTFFLSTTASGRVDVDDTLRPSMLRADALDASSLVITHVDRGILSGRIGKGFLEQHGIGGDLSAYVFGVPEISDERPSISLSAVCVGAHANGCLFYGATFENDGTFEQALPPGTYDLELGIAASGTTSRTILVAKSVIVHENQRTVVDRP